MSDLICVICLHKNIAHIPSSTFCARGIELIFSMGYVLFKVLFEDIFVKFFGTFAGSTRFLPIVESRP